MRSKAKVLAWQLRHNDRIIWKQFVVVVVVLSSNSSIFILFFGLCIDIRENEPLISLFNVRK